MPVQFYPNPEDADKGSLEDSVEVLMNAAEEYKAIVYDVGVRATDVAGGLAPKDLTAVYNWEELARVLKKIRELPEADQADQAYKVRMLNQLAEVYETLRSAKMPKLEAVRLALVSEAKQLGGGTHVAG